MRPHESGAELVLEHLQQEGFAVVTDLLDSVRDLQPILDELGEVLDRVTGERRAPGVTFQDRLAQLWATGHEPASQHFDISLPQSGVEADTPFHAGPAVFSLLVNERLLDLVERVIGPEILSNPVQHVRTKLPSKAGSDDSDGLVGTVSWHQDQGVLLDEADSSTILTVWIPLTESTVENGCMRVLRRSHATGELFEHCPGGVGGLAVAPGALPDLEPVLLPMSPGDVLLMTQSTIHSSVANITNSEVRVSLDLRYQPIGQATGRSPFDAAAFVARSRAAPDSELRDPAEWHDRWERVRRELSTNPMPRFNRWDADATACA